MNPVKLGLAILGIIILGSIALKIAGAVFGFLFGLLIPIAVLAAIGLILYGVFSGKALGSGGRGRLP